MRSKRVFDQSEYNDTLTYRIEAYFYFYLRSFHSAPQLVYVFVDQYFRISSIAES